VPKSSQVSDVITSGLPTVAIRCPHHPLFLEAIALVGVPLAAPSANRFGRTSPTSAEHVLEEFADSVSVVDGGPCTIGVESTVISADLKGKVWHLKILRPGGVSRRELKDFLQVRKLKFELTRESSTASPGNLQEHYQPRSPVVILEAQAWSPTAQNQVEKKLQRSIRSASELRLPATPQAAARMLYAEFRRLSRNADHVIWITRDKAKNDEDWETIWDRLERASSLIL